jgi:lipid II:glycine glycyltransferase (peptidoglycan interpeptide bridge formation enzyme)
MYTYKTKFLSIGELWFDEELKDVSDVDLIYYRQRPQPLTGVKYENFTTRILDLTMDEDDLWNQIHTNDRYKIRRAAQKDGISYHLWNANDIELSVLNQFTDYYDDFAESKGFSKLRKTDLKSYANKKSLYLSNIQDNDGNVLIWHSYLRGKNRVRLLQSASLRKSDSDSKYASMIGRANRYHHWQDIVAFRKMGFKIYDFGGWYNGNTDREKLGINEFKEKFGGEVVEEFNSNQAITLKGKIYQLFFISK